MPPKYLALILASVALSACATAEPNSVVAVVQKGYVLHDRIVRPARVIVAQAPAEPEEQ